MAVEVVLVELASLSQVPAADGAVQTPRPKLGPIRRNVDAASSVAMATKQTDHVTRTEVPDGDVSIAAAAEASLRTMRGGTRKKTANEREVKELTQETGVTQLPTATQFYRATQLKTG